MVLVEMNSASPLSKDQRIQKQTSEELPKKPKLPISSGTTRKILKSSGAVIGSSETIWFNAYMENRVYGECLPRAFLSNDLYAEICRVYGKGSIHFIEKIVSDFKRENGLVDAVESGSSSSE